MGINKSIINDIEIDGGETQAYVQINGGRVSISFDGRTSSVQQTMTLGELQEFAEIINKSIKEAA